MTEFYGKYRGTVANNLDPQQMGRLQVSVPAVLGDGRLSWAMPCVPFAGSGKGFFALPDTGANVWVEFEGGNPDFPIWSGCFWDLGQAPMPAIPFHKTIKTDSITLKLDDTPGAGGFVVEVSPPVATMPISISANVQGITLSLGATSIKLNGITVSINDGALEVL